MVANFFRADNYLVMEILVIKYGTQEIQRRVIGIVCKSYARFQFPW